MPSTTRVEPLDDFEKDVPVTASDREAQWRTRTARTMTSAQFLAWCTELTRDEVVPARDFHTLPFEL